MFDCVLAIVSLFNSRQIASGRHRAGIGRSAIQAEKRNAVAFPAIRSTDARRGDAREKLAVTDVPASWEGAPVVADGELKQLYRVRDVENILKVR